MTKLYDASIMAKRSATNNTKNRQARTYDSGRDRFNRKV